MPGQSGQKQTTLTRSDKTLSIAILASSPRATHIDLPIDSGPPVRRAAEWGHPIQQILRYNIH